MLQKQDPSLKDMLINNHNNDDFENDKKSSFVDVNILAAGAGRREREADDEMRWCKVV